MRLEGHVRQLSVDFVYVDLGSVDGLAVGDSLRVETGAGRGERLVASYVAGRSASCQLVASPGATGNIAVGDAVAALLPARTGAAGTDTSAERPTLQFPSPRSGVPSPARRDGERPRTGWGRIHGSLAADWLQTVSDDGEATTRDPRGRLELRGRDLLGRDLTARASLRTGRSTSASSAEGNSFPELRQLWFDYRNAGGGLGLRGGRLLVAEAGSFAYLDGGALDYLPRPSLDLSVFAGQQPGWVDRSAKGAVYVAGTAARFPIQSLRSSLLVSLLREVREEDRNRDWTYLEARVEPWMTVRFHARTQFQLTQRDDAERLPTSPDPEVDPTDFEVFRSYLESRLSVSAHYRPYEQLWWALSYDESSLVSEYEATTSAEDRFDRTARNGWRTTLNVEPSARWRTQFGGSLRNGEGFATRWSVNGSAQRRELFVAPLEALLQVRVFDAGSSRGSTPSVELEYASPKGYSLELRSGMHLYRATGTSASRSDRWIRVSSAVTLPSRLRLRLEAETSAGDNAIGSRFYGQLVRSF